LARRGGILDPGALTSDLSRSPGGDQPGAVSAEPDLTRSFGWSDMFVRPEDDPRTVGGFAGERMTLTGYLRDYRLTLELKSSGLDAAGMALRSVPPSNLSLLRLVRHLADVRRPTSR
jgi:hypothetical protein